MKPCFLSGKTLVTLALVMAAAASTVGQDQTDTATNVSQGNLGQGNVNVQAHPEATPTPAVADTLPANVAPGSPLAEVVKLIQAGMDLPTINGYIANSQSQFNLDADKIIFLKDEGAPSEVINAMMDRDKTLSASTVAPPAPPPPAPAPDPTVDTTTAPTDSTTTDTTDTAPPTQDVNLNYFYDTLTPYGSWLNVDGVGQCWRPTTVIYDAGWRPYCDRGHWVYTDYGWYWDSDYGWGATFHYGRWFHSPRFGWCWYPDTVWAPSWVTWRSDVDYCGWAPLPPFTVFMPGDGFFFQGAAVGLDCDFGLGADSFVFISPANFCNRHPGSFVVPQPYVAQIFSRTKVINSFSASGKTIVNHGFGAERIASVTHRTIDPVHVSSLPNAGRQGWRGEGFQQTMQRSHAAYNNGGGNFTPGNNFNNNGNSIHYDSAGRALQQRGYVNGHVQSQAYFNQQQQHGAEQLQEHQTYVEPGGRNYSAPPQPPLPPQGQPQPRYSGNGGNGNASNGGGNGSSGGSNKQSH